MRVFSIIDYWKGKLKEGMDAEEVIEKAVIDAYINGYIRGKQEVIDAVEDKLYDIINDIHNLETPNLRLNNSRWK